MNSMVIFHSYVKLPEGTQKYREYHAVHDVCLSHDRFVLQNLGDVLSNGFCA